jgi:signal transduction histidine kinase
VPEAAFGDFAVPDLTAALLFSVIGAWLASRRPRNAVGWLLLIAGVGGGISFFTTQYAAAALVSQPSHHLPLGYPAAVVAFSAFVVPSVIMRSLIFYAFPDGRLRTATGRVLLAIAAVASISFILAALADTEPWYAARPDVHPPLSPALSGFSTFFYDWFGRAFAPVTAFCVLCVLARLVRRRAPERGPLAWFSVAALIALVQYSVVQAWLPNFGEPIWLDAGLATIGDVTIACASVIAVLRYRLWDIDVVLRRSLVFVALTLCLAAAYLGVVVAAGAVFSGPALASSLAAALVVAAVATPLRASLQRGIDRRLYGDRHDPDAALARLGRRLGSVDDPETLLGEVAAAIADSLKVPYVALSLPETDGRPLLVEVGRDLCGTEAVTLRAQGEDLGQLVVGRREAHVAFDPADRRLLADLARQAGLAAAIVRHSHELQLSRQRLVDAREEERRRLRRDLHDGLGPALAAATLQLDEVADLVTSDPDAARLLVGRVRGGTQDMISDVRRLVYGLRPPALDELGLVGAIRQYADNLAGASAAFEIEAEPTDLVLPAAVEVALWRIATEAMTNVVRHANAQHCFVRLRAEHGTAELEVVDDGEGINEAPAGMGLTSARERAGELGGRCIVSAPPSGGTRLLAALPVQPS